MVDVVDKDYTLDKRFTHAPTNKMDFSRQYQNSHPVPNKKINIGVNFAA